MVINNIRSNIFIGIDDNNSNNNLIIEYRPKFIEVNSNLYLSYIGNLGRLMKINAEFLRKYHGLFECFLVGIPFAFENIQGITRIGYLSSLKQGLCGYLDFIGGENYNLSDIDNGFWSGFFKWMAKTDDAGRQINSVGTQSHWCTSLKSFLRALCKLENYKETAKKAYSSFPKNRKAVIKKRSPRPRLSNSDTRKIVDAAAKEFFSVRMRITDGMKLIEEGNEYNESHGVLYDEKSYESILSYLSKLYPGAIPRQKEINLNNSNLLKIIKNDFGGYSNVTAHCNISARDCIAAILLLTFTFALNPETVLKLDFSKINEMEILGKKIVVINAEKNRSRKEQVFSINKEFEVCSGITLGDILDFFKMANERLINEVSSSHKTRVFLFCNKTKILEPRGFGKNGAGASDTACSDTAFKSNLLKFIKNYDLPYFTLGQVRPTVLDELLVNSGDIKMAQSLGQQKNPWTLLNHYTSDGTKKRLEEKLGYAGFILRERWWRTNGHIDPRSNHLRARGGKSAATPGFYCLDPFDSPQPGQKKFRLCHAYGECPACMFCAASDDTGDIANYLALRDLLIQSIIDFGELSWSIRWKPVLVALENLLSLFSDEKIISAKELYVNLPKLPRLE